MFRIITQKYGQLFLSHKLIDLFQYLLKNMLFTEKKKKSALWREDGLGMGGGQLTGTQY